MITVMKLSGCLVCFNDRSVVRTRERQHWRSEKRPVRRWVYVTVYCSVEIFHP